MMPAGMPGPRRGRWAPAAAVVTILLAWAVLLLIPGCTPVRPPLVTAVVNAHLRALNDAVEMPSGDVNQVRAWFIGRVAFPLERLLAGEPDVPLRGAAVERVLERGAAVVIYQGRDHVVTLLVFRPDGLSWPAASGAFATHERGLQVRLWRAGRLGYALVGDLDATELARLAARLGG
jgi:anti-sigma factor RsiW